MKKFMIVAVVVFAFALTMNVAFAVECGQCGPRPCPCPATTINQSNNGSIYSTTKATGITGINSASSMMGVSSIVTNAATASATSQNQVGINNARISGVTTGSLTTNQSNNGSIRSITKAAGITGMNNATVKCGTAAINAGASTVGVFSINLVGSNLLIK
jgi:hypothetical protein